MTDTKYKHTELGPIPEHWEVRKSKYIWQEVNSVSPDGKEQLLSVSQYEGVKLSEGNSRSESLEGYKIVERDNLVINIMLAWLGGLGVSNYEGIVSPAYCVYRPVIDMNTRYLHYLYRTPMYLAEFARHSTGIVPSRWRMYTDDFGQVQTILPPLDEQEAMVAYLDEQTGKIDAAIEREQKMIDLLNERKQIIIQQAVTKGLNPNAPLKDSGIEWIGAIPEGWKIMRLKRLVDFAGRIGFRGYGTEDLTDEENGAITLSPSNMQNGKMTYQKCAYLKWNKYYESPEIMVHDGDILFVKTGSTYGKAAIVKALPKEATINPQLLILKNIKGDNHFIAHVLSTPFIKNQVERIVIGGTIPTISQEKIGNLRLIVPDKGEQTKIVEYIEDKTKPIDDAINAKYKLISMLRERKQIIVNEVVTGKIKVS